MRRFIVFAALLGLTACGGEVLSEEGAPPMTSELAAPGEVSEEALCSGNAWECTCAQNRTQAACNTALARCVWAYNKCSPTYE